MFVNEDVLNNLYTDAGEGRKTRAIRYQKTGKVLIKNFEYDNSKNFEISAEVYGTYLYDTYIHIKNGLVEDVSCTCEDYYSHYGICKHTLASVVEIANNPKYEKELYSKKSDSNIHSVNDFKNYSDKMKYNNFNQVVNQFYQEELDDISSDTSGNEIQKSGDVEFEPLIKYDRIRKKMSIEFKIGTSKRMYKLKNLKDFYIRMMNNEYFEYGKELAFTHTPNAFKEEDRPLLEFIMKHAEIINYANSNSSMNYRYYGNALNESEIIVGNSGLDELFEILNNKEVDLKGDVVTRKIKFTEKEPDIKFIFTKKDNGDYVLYPNVRIYDEIILKGNKYKYILNNTYLCRCSKKYEETTLKLLETFKENYLDEIEFSKNELSDFFSIIVPKVKGAIVSKDIDEDEVKEYIPQELIVKMYLDFDQNNYLIADIRFGYGKDEINPVNEQKTNNFSRNKIKETKALNMLRNSNFMLDVRNSRFILPKDEDIYKFLTEDINYYMKNFEVMVTENFKTKQIKNPKMESLGVKVENNLLSIDLSKIDIDPKEIEDIMKKYSLKKKYYRLKDGSFLDLEDNQEIQFLDKLATGMDINYKDLKDGEIQLPVSRTLYLNKLLSEVKSTEIQKNREYKEIINDLNKDQIEDNLKIPSALNANLRYYQKTGYKWLKTLDKYHFGGILADDMGLGKTVQMLSVIVDYVQKGGNRTSIVVSPSSLTLNWLNEIEKFTKNLNAIVIRGNSDERKEKINNLEKYNLIITSYDLLKRDIDVYKEKNYQFRYIVADEAQYLKNSTTKNAKAIKQIKADTKYALTGTPIENSLSELWSIFDFIMPGYLFTYRKFKNTYEIPIAKNADEVASKKLKMLIEPFVLRRNKKEVLTELPDKTITVLKNEMNEEQEKIYLTYLAQVKKELKEQINLNGFEHSQIQILSALTRLRQICCHPGLFLKDYNAGSSKLNQCIEIIEDAIEGNHKILLFSGYTSMFEIIEKEFKKRNIVYEKLTGATKVDDRIKMVDEFNSNPDIKVFLISLKAGGTGLNLTGADMVIHYDPWWNISTENQATDRAYRIGQKNNVQVYKLITKNSIEEKIYELQERKAKLADTMLDTKVKFISQLSKDEVMNLFE